MPAPPGQRTNRELAKQACWLQENMLAEDPWAREELAVPPVACPSPHIPQTFDPIIQICRLFISKISQTEVNTVFLTVFLLNGFGKADCSLGKERNPMLLSLEWRETGH